MKKPEEKFKAYEFSGIYDTIEQISSENIWIQEEWLELSQTKLKSIKGMFTNNFQYKISDQMNINSNIHLISPMVKTSYDQQPLDIKYDIAFDYRISDSFTFNIMLSNYNKYNNHFYQNRLRETYLSE